MENSDNDVRHSIFLRQNAWYGDDQIELFFPPTWQIDLVRPPSLPALSIPQLKQALDFPIESLSIPELARKARKPIILIDDLTRPTPVEPILLLILKELAKAGIPYSEITILIACGTHEAIGPEAVLRKIGTQIPEGVRVLVHDCHDCVQVGYTSTNTPIQTNRCILESDFKVGIGGIYPHPVAGFSGGGKLLALGAGGYDTIRTLHDNKEGAQFRDGYIEHAFRREINEISQAIGFDFSINLIVNQSREITSVFCGNPEAAFLAGVKFYKRYYSVQIVTEPDVVIVDMYPFDTDLQYAFDRGLWPFDHFPKNAVKVILAACPAGISYHELFPIRNPIVTRLLRRVKHFTFPSFHQLRKMLISLARVIRRRKMEVNVISPNIPGSGLKASLPKARLFKSWEEVLNSPVLSSRCYLNQKVTVVQCAPLLIKTSKQ